MSFYIKFLTGEAKGSSFKIKNDMTLGRGKADLNFKDAKISSKHLRFVVNKSGNFYIEDLGSTNGIWFGKQKIKRQQLHSGQIYRIGSVEFEISSTNPTGVPKQTDWRSVVQFFIETQNLTNSPQPTYTFKNAIRLKIIEGLQKNTEWIVGYGPRDIGPAHFEFPILEEKAPYTCFTIEHDSTGLPVVKTAYPKQVLLNGKSQTSEKIYEGLSIQIEQTRIEVSLIHERNK